MNLFRNSFAAVALIALAVLLLAPVAEASRSGLPTAQTPALEPPATPDQVLDAALTDPPERLRLFDDVRLPERPLELVEVRKTASGPSTFGLGLNIWQTGGLSRNCSGLSFQGLWTDPVTGISYARNRWYDARTASWLSEDPKGTVDSPNLYAFVGWGPHVGRDPMGLACECGCGSGTPECSPQPEVLFPFVGAPAPDFSVNPESLTGIVAEEASVSQAIDRQRGFSLDGSRLVTIGPANPTINDVTVTRFDPALIPESDAQAAWWWLQDYAHGSTQQFFASAAGLSFEPENDAQRAGAASTLVGEAGAAVIVMKRAIGRLTSEQSNASRPRSLSELEATLRAEASVAHQETSAAGTPKTHGRFGTAAHSNFEGRGLRLNEELQRSNNRFSLGVEEFRDSSGNVVRRRKRGSLGLDTVVYDRGQAVVGYDLKTGRPWTAAELEARQQRFGIPIVQIKTKAD